MDMGKYNVRSTSDAPHPFDGIDKNFIRGICQQ